MSKNKAFSVDTKEAAFAVETLNGAVAAWNRREADPTSILIGPVGGVEFCGWSSRYRVIFLHLASGRVYGIVAPKYRAFVSEPTHSYRRVPLDPLQVKRIERLPSFETPNVA
jgi:hypothetical protein